MYDGDYGYGVEANTTGCPHPSEDLDSDTAQGITYCRRCGCVVESNQLRGDVTIDATRAQALATTRYTPKPRIFTYSRSNVGGSQSRFATMETARAELNALALRLCTSSSIVASALRLYGLVLDKKVYLSRRRSVSLATCLYMACRTSGTEHLLHEFAECVGEDVATMHDTYVLYTTELRMPIPPMDPSVYLSRLAAKLDLGDLQHSVVEYGSQILQRMREDWISYGRRPYGLVAAALLTACEVYGVPRDVGQLSSMVNLSAETITLRLQEFCTALCISETGERSIPPAYRNSESAPGLRMRIISHEKRMQKLRSDLIQSFHVALRENTGEAVPKGPVPTTRSSSVSSVVSSSSTTSQSRNPSLNRRPPTTVWKEMWETYWLMREECATLCNTLMERTTLANRVHLKSDLVTARRATELEFQIPMYVPLAERGMPVVPPLDDAGLEQLHQDALISTHFGSPPNRGTSQNKTQLSDSESSTGPQIPSINEAIQRVKATWKRHKSLLSAPEGDDEDDLLNEVAENERLARKRGGGRCDLQKSLLPPKQEKEGLRRPLLNEEENASQSSTPVADEQSVAPTGEDVEDEYDILSISDLDPAEVNHYLVTDYEEIARRTLMHQSVYGVADTKHMVQTTPTTSRSRDSTVRQDNDETRSQKSGKRARLAQTTELGNKLPNRPSEAVEQMLYRGPHSGIDLDVMRTLLDGSDALDDIPSWNASYDTHGDAPSQGTLPKGGTATQPHVTYDFDAGLDPFDK